MKTRKTLLAALFAVASVSGVSAAQKITGDISALKGQKEVNIVLDFTGTLVGGKAEADYIADETKDKTADEKAQWLSEWNDKLRSDAFGALVKAVNDKTSEKLFAAGAYTSAGYTVLGKVRDITPGFFGGIITRPSAVRAYVSFVKTGETAPFATSEFKNSSDVKSQVVPYLITRIVMSFSELGDDIGDLILKALK